MIKGRSRVAFFRGLFVVALATSLMSRPASASLSASGANRCEELWRGPTDPPVIAKAEADARKAVARLNQKFHKGENGVQSATPTTEIFMRAGIESLATLDFIDRFGILNQYITSTSNGMSSFEARYTTERDSLAESNKNLSTDILPKYGYLNVKGRSLNSDEFRAYQYGKIVFNFKDDVRDRTTFHIGDSLYNSEPVDPLNSFEAATGAREDQPSYYEAQIWGPLNLDHVKEVFIDTEYSSHRGVVNGRLLAKLKLLADKYGFRIYSVTHSIVFNQSNALLKVLLYDPKLPSEEPAFRFQSATEIEARLPYAGEMETVLLLNQLRQVAGVKAKPTLMSYATNASQKIRTAVAIILSDLNDPAAAQVRGLDPEAVRFISEKTHPGSASAKNLLNGINIADGEALTLMNQTNFSTPQGKAILSHLAQSFIKTDEIRKRLVERIVKPWRVESTDQFVELLTSSQINLSRMAAAAIRFVPRQYQLGFATRVLTMDASVQTAFLESLTGEVPKDQRDLIVTLTKSSDHFVSLAAEAVSVRNQFVESTKGAAELLLAEEDFGRQRQGLFILTVKGFDSEVATHLSGLQAWQQTEAVQAIRKGLLERNGFVDPRLLDAIRSTDDNTWKTFEYVINRTGTANQAWVDQALSQLSLDPTNYFLSTVRFIQYLAVHGRSPRVLNEMKKLANLKDDPNAKQIAIQSLGLMATPEAIAILQELSKRRDRAIREGALSALTALGVNPN